MHGGKLILQLAIGLAVLGGAGLAFAQVPEATTLTNAQIQAQEIRNAAQTRVQELRNAASQRLEDVKLRVCENREAAIQRIIQRMTARGERHLGVFDTIAERVKNFYTDRGRTLDNYDALVAEVDAKRTVAVAAIEALTTFDAFSCDGAPQEYIAAFRQLHQDMLAALRGYRTAIKDLIVGVKSIQGQESSANRNVDVNTNSTNTNTEEDAS